MEPQQTRVHWIAVIASHGHAAKLVPLVYNDRRGHWTLQVKDLLSGQVKTAAFDVD